MGIFRATKSLAGRLIDVRVDRWMNFDMLSDVTTRTIHTVKNLVIPEKSTRQETFEESLLRLNLTEADITQRKREFTRLIYFFITLSVLLIAYGLYMAFHGSVAAALIAFSITLYCLSQAFRFHFWLFQINNRKLGCTLSEWFHSNVAGTPDDAPPPPHSNTRK